MDISAGLMLLLGLCLLLACAFEFVNGFHDTANAVATVIYTNTLRPTVAVVWSGFCNFVGVFAGGIGVAMGIVNLLPVEILVDQQLSHGMSMIFALLISAIIWNLGTWYFGLPASSSHALIGSILGIGLAYYFLPESTGTAVNWTKAQEIGLSLLISPIFGFAFAIFIMFLFKRMIKSETIYKEPLPGRKPPLWIRTILMLTCTMVSFFHGSNDGQKGVGLIMLILIGIVPVHFALKSDFEIEKVYKSSNQTLVLLQRVDTNRLSLAERKIFSQTIQECNNLTQLLKGKISVQDIEADSRFQVRKNIMLLNRNSEKLLSGGNLSLSFNELNSFKSSLKSLKSITDYAPQWVIVLISVSLGLGTMVGWRRIVKTVGEKIGKQHMSYAQGASAEMVAASTIGLSTGLGLPVSTTHVLSSGIAGAMVAKKGLKNLQPKTIRNILLAWVLTLPVTVLVSGGLFLLFRWLF